MEKNKTPIVKKKAKRLYGLDAYLWLAPSILLVALFVLQPVVEVFYMAFGKVSAAGLVKKWGTVENFTYLFKQPAFSRVMVNTAVWTVVVVFVSLILSIVMALVLNERFAFRRFHRTMLLLPWATSLLITSSAWKYILTKEYGAMNALLLRLGITKTAINYLGSTVSAMTWMMVVGVIVTIPFMTFTLLSGLQSISPELYEAASIDGAGFWKKLFKVTLPLLKPALNVTIVLNVIYVFNSFVIVNTLTNGAPANTTHTVTTYIYYLAFSKDKYGASAAMSVLSFVILLVFALLYMNTQMKEDQLR